MPAPLSIYWLAASVIFTQTNYYARFSRHFDHFFSRLLAADENNLLFFFLLSPNCFKFVCPLSPIHPLSQDTEETKFGLQWRVHSHYVPFAVVAPTCNMFSFFRRQGKKNDKKQKGQQSGTKVINDIQCVPVEKYEIAFTTSNKKSLDRVQPEPAKVQRSDNFGKAMGSIESSPQKPEEKSSYQSSASVKYDYAANNVDNNNVASEKSRVEPTWVSKERVDSQKEVLRGERAPEVLSYRSQQVGALFEHFRVLLWNYLMVLFSATSKISIIHILERLQYVRKHPTKFLSLIGCG